MSEELKTMKDIPFNILGDDPDDVDEHWAKRELSEQIKEEAIKWVKVLSEEDEDEIIEKYDRKIFHNFEPSCEIGVVINFIKYFFNITEEDLK